MIKAAYKRYSISYKESFGRFPIVNTIDIVSACSRLKLDLLKAIFNHHVLYIETATSLH
jgi:hypothetical protein